MYIASISALSSVLSSIKEDLGSTAVISPVTEATCNYLAG